MLLVSCTSVLLTSYKVCIAFASLTWLLRNPGRSEDLQITPGLCSAESKVEDHLHRKFILLALLLLISSFIPIITDSDVDYFQRGASYIFGTLGFFALSTQLHSTLSTTGNLKRILDLRPLFQLWIWNNILIVTWISFLAIQKNYRTRI